MTTSDPIAEIIGDYRAFTAMQRDRLAVPAVSTSHHTRSATSPSALPIRDLYVHERPLLRAPCEGELRKRLERASDLLIVLAGGSTSWAGVAPVSLIELHPARSSARLAAGPRAPRRRRR